jgi:hypothetical protein
MLLDVVDFDSAVALQAVKPATASSDNSVMYLIVPPYFFVHSVAQSDYTFASTAIKRK